jgi:hypothetical protein
LTSNLLFGKDEKDGQERRMAMTVAILASFTVGVIGGFIGLWAAIILKW